MAANPNQRPLQRFGRSVGYGLAQTARTGWFLSAYAVSARLSRGSIPDGIKVSRPGPGWPALLADMADLLRRDWANIQAGRYPAPDDLIVPPDRLAATTWAYFRDLAAVNRRRRSKAHQEPFRRAGGRARTDGLPRYYLQNFHWQSDGYLSRRSARLYDFQTDVLFGGTTDAMRRQALVPIGDWLARRDDDRPARLLDIGAGTGQFLHHLRRSFPEVRPLALDLSRAYLGEAMRRTAGVGGIDALLAPAERLPLADASVDIVTSIFLFHELPAKVRAQAVAEMARVLRPGGLVVLLDSLQFGDHAPYDPLLEFFPQAFHEPYYLDYARSDLIDLFARAGLAFTGRDRAYLAKRLTFEKPAR
jgi:ubiquinone/menaquinone biosynthesis C-methylase UbiE